MHDLPFMAASEYPKSTVLGPQNPYSKWFLDFETLLASGKGRKWHFSHIGVPIIVLGGHLGLRQELAALALRIFLEKWKTRCLNTSPGSHPTGSEYPSSKALGFGV